MRATVVFDVDNRPADTHPEKYTEVAGMSAFGRVICVYMKLIATTLGRIMGILGQTSFPAYRIPLY